MFSYFVQFVSCEWYLNPGALYSGRKSGLGYRIKIDRSTSISLLCVQNFSDDDEKVDLGSFSVEGYYK